MLFVLVGVAALAAIGSCSTWSEWWTYEGISGPEFWGLVNPEWSLCSKGKMQSPVNINPRTLLFDPSLRHLHVDKHRVSGILLNTGHDVKIYLDELSPHIINITGGPFTYQYRVVEIIFHWGSIESLGSEHTLDGQSFPAEIQILGYNTDLYGNLTQATYSTNGLAAIGLLVQIAKGNVKPNAEFENIAHELKRVRFKGQQVKIRHLSISGLLPRTHEYIAYDGSLTQPGCHETVTWVIMNKPIYITHEQLRIMREIMQGDETKSKSSVPMENNIRPTMDINHRPMRTNINFPKPSKGCSMEKEFHYQGSCSTWSEWWTYEGISGPEFWGLVNPEWSLCNKGKMQSPVNINPRTLLFDPSLRHLHVDKHRVSGILLNTGHDVKIYLDELSPHIINITGGPFTYQYRVVEIIFHWGSIESLGSEHTLDGQSFPAEIQILGYNTDLYGNLTQATYSTNGLVAIGILVQIAKGNVKPNAEFENIAHELKRVRFKGQQVKIRHLSISGLLPRTHEYIAYDGSLTQPGCHETVTWVIMNKPIYITHEQLRIMREIMQGDETKSKSSVPMENNIRPTMDINHRPMRTNINFPKPSKGCSMEKEFHYQANLS